MDHICAFCKTVPVFHRHLPGAPPASGADGPRAPGTPLVTAALRSKRDKEISQIRRELGVSICPTLVTLLCFARVSCGWEAVQQRPFRGTVARRIQAAVRCLTGGYVPRRGQERGVSRAELRQETRDWSAANGGCSCPPRTGHSQGPSTKCLARVRTRAFACTARQLRGRLFGPIYGKRRVSHAVHRAACPRPCLEVVRDFRHRQRVRAPPATIGAGSHLVRGGLRRHEDQPAVVSCTAVVVRRVGNQVPVFVVNPA